MVWVCITMLQVIRDNYPEVCHRAYIAPSNFIFMLIWSIARLMLDAKQGARVVVSTYTLETEEQARTLSYRT
jgi:CRAL/TRIO domain